MVNDRVVKIAALKESKEASNPKSYKAYMMEHFEYTVTQRTSVFNRTAP